MNTIIVGKGAAGKILFNEIKKNNKLEFIGFVDDFKDNVLGKILDIRTIVQTQNIKLVYIAMPSVDKEVIKKITELLKGLDVLVRLLPSYAEIIQYGNATLDKTKPISIEDILGRPPIKQDFRLIKSKIKGKVVFVSGAAGSIGSELSHQIALNEPLKLLCFDKAETPIFNLQNKLSWFKNAEYIIGDITDKGKLKKVFEENNIDLVLHAAAYKHVPLMESNPYVAVRNNIYGTNNLLSLACANKVPNIVIVSTDKAVNPTNIMGATKRAVEKLMEYYSMSYFQSKISAVRFGNVLRSNGSVVNIFEEKINKGEDLSVTHLDIVRYFMTIEEAAQLILISAFQGKRNEIFVLDMGEPIKIIKLAEDMINLSGKIPYIDIDIKITGLRPGEKLYEELLINKDKVKKTSNRKIFIVDKEEVFDPLEFYHRIIEFEEEINTKNNQDIRSWLMEIIPSYNVPLNVIL